MLQLQILLAVRGSTVVATGPTVTTHSGPITGTVLTNGVFEWAGVPYAQAPIGDLRWRTPLEVKPWTTAKVTSRFGATCAQATAKGSLSGEENCLFLNVWAPRAPPPPAGNTNTALLPVMVWIHGGGFEGGSSTLYNATNLVAFSTITQLPVLVISMNYRLSVFGFLHSPALAARNAGNGGSLGLADQRLALEWVQTNAKLFGGDPSRVTVFGESAGGGSISSHLAMPHLSSGLFQQAILESSSFVPACAMTTAAAADTFAGIVAGTGCGKEKEGGVEDAVTACLVNQSTASLIAAKVKGKECCDFYPVFVPYSPVVEAEGNDLPLHPFEAVTAPDFLKHAGVRSVLHGVNRDEGFFFEDPADYQMSPQTLMSRWTKHYGAGSVSPLTELYGAVPSGEPKIYSKSFNAEQATLGDFWALCPARRASQYLSSTGGVDADVWMYYFQHPPKGDGVPYAYHSSEIRFVFQWSDVLANAAEIELSKQIGLYWLSYATHGDPNTATTSSLRHSSGATTTREEEDANASTASSPSPSPLWPKFGASGVNGSAMLFDVVGGTAAGGGVAASVGHKQAQCDRFWKPFLENVMARCMKQWPCSPGGKSVLSSSR